MAPSSPEPLQQAGRITTVILLLASLLFLSSPSAGASPAAAPAMTVPVMVVLDASGSMKTADAPGPRIDAAKAAVSQLVDRLPANTQVGLQVYGTGTGSSDAEKSAGCNDIRTLMPVATLDTPAMKTAVSKVTASGYTPIGKALEAAAAALPAEGPRSIVLVSDGEDTCAPPAPCDVAKKLKQQGVDLVVHTVGFKVDPTARQQLSCIAAATNGTYSDAADAGQLTQALQTKVDYAITGYSPTGTAVTGDNDPSEQAPLLAPGQYVDHYALGWAGDNGAGRPSTKKYYTIPISPGVRPYVSVTVVPPVEGVNSSSIQGLGAKIRLLNKARQECASPQSDLTYVNKDRPFGSTTVLAGPVIGVPIYYSDTCPSSGVLIVEITRIGTAYANTSLPLEIVVRMEPPADISAVPPAAGPGPVLASPNPEQQKAVAIKGGSSFNDAAQLLSGATYSDSVVTGESRYYQVPLRWGQRLSYTVTEVGPARPALGTYGAQVGVDVLGPVRNEIATTTQSTVYWFSTVAAEPITASTTYPVRYTNRTTSLRNSGLDGVHYLRLTAGFNSERKSSSTRFLITVVVSGAVEKGPVYLPPGTIAPTGTSKVPSTSPTTPTGATTSAGATLPSTSSSQDSGSSTPPTTVTSGSGGSSFGGSAPSTTAAATSADQTVAMKQVSGSAAIDSDNGWPVWIYAVLGLLLVGIVGVGIGIAWSRRSGSPSGR
jgi:Ca-activated chloride channel family protein